MMSLRSAGLWLVLGACLGAKRPDVCEEPTESCGAIPPTLPGSFVMKGSRLDLATNSSYWFEEYFDPENLRGKYVEVFLGLETHRIFDYHTQQIVSYFHLHQGGRADENVLQSLSCRVEEMSSSQFTTLLGKKFGYYDPLRPRMYNAYESLRYGGPYSYAFDRNASWDEHRRVSCLTFRGCVYDPNEEATYDTTFTWLHPNYLPAFRASHTPLRIREKGGYYSRPGPSRPSVWTSVDTDKSIAWFEENPYMDQEIFQPPVRMECSNMREQQSVVHPTMPPAFSTRMETFVTTENLKGDVVGHAKDSYQELWYDSVRKLVRHDHLPSGLEMLDVLLTFDKETMITAVHDFNMGLTFYTDRVQGTCIFQPIRYDVLVLSETSTKDNVVMASPQEILEFDPKMKYKGKYQIRGMTCNGFSARVKKSVKGDGDAKSLLHEIYVTTDGWHEEVNGRSLYEVPVRDIQVLETEDNGRPVQAVFDTNYYGFLPTAPPLSVYDVAGCAVNVNKSYFRVDLKAGPRPEELSPAQVVDQRRDVFLDTVRLLLTEGADLGSPLRIQDLQVVYRNSGDVGLTFTVLDVFDAKGSVSVPLRGQKLVEAKETLTTKVNVGTAVFKIVWDYFANVEVEFTLVPKSLVEIQKTVKYIDLSAEFRTGTSDPATDAEGGRFSKGSLAALGIGMLILGLGVGAAGMLLYFRKFMRPRSNTETANFVMTEST